ncbi:MAG: SUMF1/EgtB/PvdO family nonheme iron enzyme [Bacteroidota bacterium]
MRSFSFIPAVLSLALLCVSFSWTNDPLRKVKTLDKFVKIPSGNAYVETKSVAVKEFFIAKQEVTNKQYRSFQAQLKASGRLEEYNQAMVIGKNWSLANAPAAEDEGYHSHPAYDRFPVVNISHQAAELYCEWLAAALQEEVPMGYEVTARLPTRAEWIRAARADGEMPYAWNSPYLTLPNGNYRCNFRRLGPEHIHFNEETGAYEIVQEYDGVDVTLSGPVEAYEPNHFGIYNMCGNVAEMIDQEGMAAGGHYNSSGYDVRVESTMPFDGPSPYVGFRPVVIITKS